MSPVGWVAFLAGGAVGAPLRYSVGGFVDVRTGPGFPWGTLVVNVSGSLLLGFLTGLAMFSAAPDTAQIVLDTGFCGACTTFSAFSFQTVRLLQAGRTKAAVLNSLGSLVTCVGGRGRPGFGRAVGGRTAQATVGSSIGLTSTARP